MNWKPNRRLIGVLLVTALVLFAGCTGPADDANGTVGDGAAVTPTDGLGAGDDVTTETDIVGGNDTSLTGGPTLGAAGA